MDVDRAMALLDTVLTAWAEARDMLPKQPARGGRTMNTAIEMASPAGIVDVPPSTYAAEELARVVRFAYSETTDYGDVIKLLAVRRHPGGWLSWYDQLRRAEMHDYDRQYRFACAVWRNRREVIVVNVDNGRVLYAPEWMR